MNRNKVYTIKDIAEDVGVAPSTVSRVLNNSVSKIPIAERTRNRVMAAARKLNYSPNVNARRLARKDTNTIALVLPSCITEGHNIFSDFTLVRMLEGIEEEVLKKEYRLLMVFKSKKFKSQREYLRLFHEGSIDGMLIWGYNYNDNYIDELRNYPVVLTNSRPRNAKDINYVGHDNVSAIRETTQEVIDHGHRHLLYLSGSPNVSISHERLEGFKQALQNNGLPCNENDIIESGFYTDDGYNTFMLMHNSGRLKKYDAIICSNDDAAVGCYKAAAELGLKIPDDIAMTGGDGVQPHLELSPHLKTFEVDCAEMGRLAVVRLLELMKNKRKKPCQDIIPVKLRTGESI
jgi:DNA-binding LacI/PurR family transcriptional regulator